MEHRYFLKIVACILLLLGCASVNAQAQDYFPQQLDNRWTYIKTGPAQSRTTWSNRIIKYKNGRWHHSNFWGDGIERKLTEDEEGNVSEVTNSSEPHLWYKLSAKGSESWSLSLTRGGPPCVDQSLLTIVSNNETVEVPAGRFTNCIKIRFSNRCADAGVVFQWFAPDVGLVKQEELSIAGTIVSELQSAKVNGTSYPSSFQIEFSLDSLEYTYNLMPPVNENAPGPRVAARIKLVNATRSTVRLDFTSGQRYDFIVIDRNGNEVFRWSADKLFIAALGSETLRPEESLIYDVKFNLPGGKNLLPEGAYTMRALVTATRPLEASLAIAIKHVQ